MKPRPRQRLFAAWLALVGLLLQIGLATEHSARHFDHLVGSLHRGHAAAHAAVNLQGVPQTPAPDGPADQGLDHCAVGLGLAATANIVLADPGHMPVPRSYTTARLDSVAPSVSVALTRPGLPPVRAPPAIEVFA